MTEVHVRKRRPSTFIPTFGFSISITYELLRTVEEMACDANISRSAMGRMLIEEALEARAKAAARAAAKQSRAA